MKQLLANLFWGAIWGMIAWQVYAVVEYTALTVVPLWRYQDMTVAGWNWHWNFVLFGFYTVTGLIAGGIGGVLFGGSKTMAARNRQQRLKSVGTLTLALAFLANLLTVRLDSSTVLVIVLVTCALIWSLFSETWAERFVFFANPWGTAVILLGAPWIGNQILGRRPLIVHLAAGIALIAAGIGISIAVARLKRSPHPRVLLHAATLFGAFIVLGCAVRLSPGAQLPLGRVQAGLSDKSKPNVVLVTMDTVRADHLSLYGYNRKTTPNLENLAQSSTVFTHAMAAGNVTLISHAAIFTGLYGSWSGVGKPTASHGAPILDKYPTMPSLLAKNGYFTGAVVANTGNLQPAFGFDRGFQFFDSLTSPQLLRLDKPYLLRNAARLVLDRFTATTEFDLSTRRAEEINRDAFKFLDQARSSTRPFFLFLNYMDAHSAYAPPPPFDKLYPGKDGTATLVRYMQLTHDLAVGSAKLPQRDLQHYLSQYDGGIAYIDSQIGRLILALKQRGLYDNTLIIITSDHGESLGDRNLLFHGLSVYQNQVHVPLIVKYPGDCERRVVGTPIGHVDILPTVLDVAGIAAPHSLQGISFRRKVNDGERRLISEGFPRPGFAKIPGFNFMQRAIYRGKWKFVETGAGRRELYDVESDQAEAHDMCSVQSGQCEEMRRDLDAWTSMIPRDTTPYKIDRKTMERLRSLGYVGN